jgi:hypothetical protein
VCAGRRQWWLHLCSAGARRWQQLLLCQRPLLTWPRASLQVAVRDVDAHFRSQLLGFLLAELPELDAAAVAAGALQESALARVVAKAKRGAGFAASEELLCSNQVGGVGARVW